MRVLRSNTKNLLTWECVCMVALHRVQRVIDVHCHEALFASLEHTCDACSRLHSRGHWQASHPGSSIAQNLISVAATSTSSIDVGIDVGIDAFDAAAGWACARASAFGAAPGA